MKSIILRLAAVAVAFGGMSLNPAFATIHRVNCASGPFFTIQSAVSAAVDGDTILVNGCTYNENVVIAGFQRLHVVAGDQGYFGARTAGVGAVPPPPNVIVSGGGLPGACFLIDSSRDVDIVGFWLRGCSGGGVVISGSEDILIQSNRIQSVGARGIHAIGTLRGIYTGNIVALTGDYGILLEDTVMNTVADNFLYRAGDAGILMIVGLQNRITNNDVRFSLNEGIVASGNEPRIERNSLSGNGGVSQLLFDAASSLADGVANGAGPITDLGAGTELMDNF